MTPGPSVDRFAIPSPSRLVVGLIHLGRWSSAARSRGARQLELQSMKPGAKPLGDGSACREPPSPFAFPVGFLLPANLRGLKPREQLGVRAG